MGALIGSANDMFSNIGKLAKHVELSTEGAFELFLVIRKWIVVDNRNLRRNWIAVDYRN